MNSWKRYRVHMTVNGVEVSWRHWTARKAIERAIRLARDFGPGPSKVGVPPGPVVFVSHVGGQQLLRLQVTETGKLVGRQGP